MGHRTQQCRLIRDECRSRFPVQMQALEHGGICPLAQGTFQHFFRPGKSQSTFARWLRNVLCSLSSFVHLPPPTREVKGLIPERNLYL